MKKKTGLGGSSFSNVFHGFWFNFVAFQFQARICARIGLSIRLLFNPLCLADDVEKKLADPSSKEVFIWRLAEGWKRDGSLYEMKEWMQKRGRRVVRVLIWFAAVGATLLLAFGCLVPGNKLPSMGPQGIDKWMHFIAFFVWAAAWAAALDADWRTAFMVWLAGALFGAALELAQAMLPWKRSAELWDWIADVLGAGSACLLWLSVRRLDWMSFIRPRVEDKP